MPCQFPQASLPTFAFQSPCTTRMTFFGGQWAGPLDLYGKEDAPALHESPSFGRNSWCQHGITGRISSLCETRARWAERFHDELYGHVLFRPGEGRASSGCTLSVTHHAMTTNNHTNPDWSLPGSTRTAPSVAHQDGGVKYVLVHHRRLEEETTSP